MGSRGGFKRTPIPGGPSLPAPVRPDKEAGLEPEALSYLFDEADEADEAEEGVPAVAPAAGEEGGAADEMEIIDLSGPDTVRASLATKLSRLLPGLGRERRERVFDLTCRALERLARDEALIVRVALATAIKDVACAPPALCLQLAQDLEAAVAEPILRCCAGLGDRELLALVQRQPPPWALAAIASRPQVSDPLSTALVETGDVTATGLLIENHGAEISETTLADLVEAARLNSEWQGKLVRRPMLPRRLAVRLATFVDQAALDFLRTRKDFDIVTAREVVAVARRRIDWLRDTDPAESADHRAARLFRKGRLDESVIEDALSWKQFDFVRSALALRAGVPALLIDKILQSHSGRAVTALSWRADLPMRTAFALQKDMSAVTPNQFVYPRDGTSYPLSADEMTWQLEFFGVPPRPAS